MHLKDYSKFKAMKKTLKTKIFLVIIYFLITMILTLFELYKDMKVIDKQIPSSLYFTKLLISLPLNIYLIYLIQKALDIYSISKVYDFILIFFIIMYLVLGFIFLPNCDIIQKGRIWTLDIFCDGKMRAKGLEGFQSLSYMYSEWISTLCCVLYELWGSLAIGYGFYTFANFCCNIVEMNSILPYLSTITAVTMISSAILLCFEAWIRNNVGIFNIDSLFFITLGVLTILVLAIKRYMLFKKLFNIKNNVLEFNSDSVEQTNYVSDKTKKTSLKEQNLLTFEDNTILKPKENIILDLLRSKLLRSMCLCAIFYSLNSGIVDMSFKNALAVGCKAHNLSSEKYSKPFLIFSFFLSGSFILLYNFVARNWLITRSWLFISIIPPTVSLIFVIAITSFNFFNCFFSLSNNLKNLITYENWTASLGISCIKISKYMMYDVSKEMLTMKIPQKYRFRYKSLYDGICLKLGKSAVSLYNIFFTLIGVNDIRNISILTLILYVFFYLMWIKSIVYLNVKYSCSHNDEIDVDIE